MAFFLCHIFSVSISTDFKNEIMIEIKIGEKQPLECEKCEDFMGYQVSDYIKTHFYMAYKESGEFNNAFYGDYQPRITEGVTAFCMNCATKLKFKVRR